MGRNLINVGAGMQCMTTHHATPWASWTCCCYLPDHDAGKGSSAILLAIARGHGFAPDLSSRGSLSSLADIAFAISATGLVVRVTLCSEGSHFQEYVYNVWE